MWRQLTSRHLNQYTSRFPLSTSPLSRILAATRSRIANAAFLYPDWTSPRSMLSRKHSDLSRTVNSEDLFRYTSGQWLIDNEAQKKLRYVKFNLDSLCRIAAAHFSDTTKCVRVVKLEGSFNKALLLAMDDGNEVIAKIPCLNAGPPSLTTASEVATLKFLRSKTSIRVPEVFAWSSDPANAVGAEFIIMEKIKGVALSETWETMNTLERYKIIDQIVQIEKELSSTPFPAYGSLFLRESLPDTYRQFPLPSKLDPEGLFCIGPSCKRTWWYDDFGDIFQPISGNKGPWVNLPEYALSIIQREIAHIAQARAAVKRQLHNFDESQSIAEYEGLLEKVNMILPILSHDTRVVEVSDSVIWHNDLHLGNIFVSLADPSIIEGIIDWQSSLPCPLFIQAQFPEFLTPPKDYKPGTDLPNLPDDFDSLSPEQKEQATNDNELSLRSKYYEMSTLAHNQHVYKALKLDSRLWEPFTYCQLFSHGSLVPLRHCLIRLYQDWSSLGLPGSCPFSILETELQRHQEQRVQYEDRLYLWRLVKNQLSTGNDGWVPNNRWEVIKKANKELYNMYIETMGEELTPQAAAKNWPFPPPEDQKSFLPSAIKSMMTRLPFLIALRL